MEGKRSLGSSSSASSVDESELRRFGALSEQWAKEEQSFKALHSFNRLRIPWIVNAIASPSDCVNKRLVGLRIADIACGGGIVSIPLARLGASVTAVDPSQEAVDAVSHAVSVALRGRSYLGDVKAICSPIEDFAKKNSEGFDVVIASEALEHVANLEQFVSSCVSIARKGAPIFFTTINKTLASKFLAVWLAEEVLKVVPSGVHDWSKFVSPTTLSSILESNDCSVRIIHGIAYNPFTNEWFWISNTSVNYALMAVRN